MDPRRDAPRACRSVLLAIAVLAAAHVAVAGAWTMPAGGVYAKLTYGASSANDQFGFDGGTKPLVEGITDYPFADRSFYLFGEYGINDALTFSMMVPIKRLFVHDNVYKYTTTGFSDPTLGARYLLYSNDGWVGSASASVSVPLGYHRDLQPPLGAGQMDFSVAANVGRSLWPLPAYATGSLGFRLRSGIYTSRVSANASANEFFHDSVDYANELFYMVEGGWTFFNRLLVHIVGSGVVSLRSSGNAFTITSVPSTQRYMKLGGGVAYGPIDHLELSADVFTTPIGMNTAKSIDIFLGIGTKF